MESQFKIEKSLNISEVPSDFPVRFCLLTNGKLQYVAYFDDEHRMTVALRSLGSDKWKYQILPSKIGWDSHNSVTMAVDDDGHLHLSGNMHCVPLIYFRTEQPGDISTLKKVHMTGDQEEYCTYPKFLRDAGNRLIFHYRDGGSGNGSEIYNVYDLKSKCWRRLLDCPLTDGKDQMNAYMTGPIRGPDGWFHMHGVWRDTPDCATNHHLFYARSDDLCNWESVFGDKVELPITLDSKSLWVDPIPNGGGIINGGHKLYFDADHQPILSYHKSDAEGNMQIYAARPEAGKWKKHLLTDWQKPVLFSSRGTMGFIGIWISGLSQVEPGMLVLDYRHRDYGFGHLLIDAETLSPLRKEHTLVPEMPEELEHLQSPFPGMRIQRVDDIGSAGEEGLRYILQWESLEGNRDLPRPPPLPEASMLRLHKLSANHGN